jgi:hypothetical protein
MQQTGVGALQLMVPQTTVGGVEVLLVEEVVVVVVTDVVVIAVVALVVIALEVEPVVTTAVVEETAVVGTLALVVAAELCVATVVADDVAAPPSSRVERSVELEPLHAASHTTPSDTSKRPSVFIPSPFSNAGGTGQPFELFLKPVRT